MTPVIKRFLDFFWRGKEKNAGEAVKCQQGVEIDGHFLFQARSLNILERIARKSGNEPTPAWLLA